MTKPAHTPKQVECDITDCEKCETGKYQSIKLCPMHKAAPALFDAAKLALLALTGEGLNDGEGAIELLEAAIAKAEE